MEDHVAILKDQKNEFGDQIDHVMLAMEITWKQFEIHALEAHLSLLRYKQEKLDMLRESLVNFLQYYIITVHSFIQDHNTNKEKLVMLLKTFNWTSNKAFIEDISRFWSSFFCCAMTYRQIINKTHHFVVFSPSLDGSHMFLICVNGWPCMKKNTLVFYVQATMLDQFCFSYNHFLFSRSAYKSRCKSCQWVNRRYSFNTFVQ